MNYYELRFHYTSPVEQAIVNDILAYELGEIGFDSFADNENGLSGYIPDTLYDVIYQTEPVLQYAPVANGHINNTPTERIYNVARFLLENGSVLPANVLYQSESIQGGIYFQYTDSVLQTTTYFCTP